MVLGGDGQSAFSSVVFISPVFYSPCYGFVCKNIMFVG